MNKKSVLLFLRAQVSAFSGGITDYGFMILLTELLNIHFTISILISGTAGAIVNFCINRYWAFKIHGQYSSSAKNQAARFFTVVIGSISLKSSGTYLLHHILNLDYKFGRLLIDLIVSYGFNYPLMRFWVFSGGANSRNFNNQSERSNLL